MTAASGVLHKEYHEKEWSKTGGEFQMVQLWVNLPAKNKMDAPGYQPILREEFGQVILPDNRGIVEVIAGEYKGIKGPAKSFTPIEMYNVRLNRNSTVSLSLPENYNTGFLVIEGEITISNKTIKTDHFVLFANDGTDIEIKAENDAVILILSGEPINEAIFPYGPFVMNSKEEIIQAYTDFDNGLFGYLED